MGNDQTNRFVYEECLIISSLPAMASIDQVWSTTAVVVGHCFGTQLGLVGRVPELYAAVTLCGTVCF